MSDKIRISIASLVSSLNNKPIGIVNNRDLKSGNIVYSAIGGASLVLNHDYLIKHFKASNFESEKDARFIIPKSELENFKNFINSKAFLDVIDISISHELKEELTTIELESQIKPFLTINEYNEITTKFVHKIINIGKSRKSDQVT